MDNFYEIFIPAKKTPKYTLVTALSYISAAAAIMYMLFGSMELFTVLGALSLVFYFGRRYLFVEYEYELTDGVLDISIIYDKRKRKQLQSINIREALLLAPLNSEELNKYNSFKSVKCYTGDVEENSIYCLAVKKGEIQTIYYVLFDKKMIDLCFRVNPRNVIRS